MTNPYLTAQREKFEALRASIEGLQTRAVAEKRDLSVDELRSLTEQADAAKVLAEQIESLTDIETRNAKVSSLAATVSKSAEQELAENNRSLTVGSTRVSNTTAKDRDPGHYTRSSQNSFFADIVHSRDGDQRAVNRLGEHSRALSTGANGPGVVPPHWLVEEFELLARQGRRLANAVRNIPLGDDPRPITLPKQITGTDAVVAEQTNENDATGAADAWDSDVDTVTMKPTAGIQIVSRQMLDMSSPAVDMLIYGDMLSVYNQKVEAKVGAALIAAAGAAVTTFATEAAFGTGSAALDAVIDAGIAVRNARKLPADVLAMGVLRYGSFLKIKDTTGRPLIVTADGGPMNVAGVGQVDMDGRIEGLGVIASDGISTGSALTHPDHILAFRAADQILFESNTLQFRYEQPLGPESVKLGIWGYTGFISRQATKSVKQIIVTAA
jgi:HK97 family phage major capsid protein